MRGDLLDNFRELCRRRGLAVTHQRTVVYEVLLGMHGHPSPEEVYERVREQIPSISLATVYKTVHTFLEAGIVSEVSLHHRSLRLESNQQPHHHMVCTGCKTIFDLAPDAIQPVQIKETLPERFQLQRLSVELLGLCERCAASRTASLQSANQRLEEPPGWRS